MNPMEKITKKEQGERLKRNEAKWGKTLMAAGWTAFPSVILERQRGLGLEALDINIILQLAKYWWHPDNPPHPSKRTIAECIGVDPSTVRRRIQRLEELGFIRRSPRRGDDGRQLSNTYHFDGLIKEATTFAQEQIEARAAEKREAASRRTRRKPKPSTARDKKGGGA
jgi:DNA-binding MarR family transcriptional regulator